MAPKALSTSFSKLVAVAALVAAACVLSTAPQAAPRPVLTAAVAAQKAASEPIPAEFNPATHALPSNLYVRYVSHSVFRAHCHWDSYGCEISPSGKNSLTNYYIFIDVDKVPPSLRPVVLRHEEAHVLGWRH
jgi:ABC-type transport system substrate-binding protein